jgi:hypothetical protein
VCVNLSVCPSGSDMTSGVLVGCTLVTGATGSTKWLVAPALATTMSIAILIPPVLSIA